MALKKFGVYDYDYDYDFVEVIRAATCRSILMSGLSQADCLWARDSSATGAPDSADHCSKPKTRGRSSGTLQLHVDRMEACSDEVPAAEARKAGNASEDTRRMPRPPSRIVAWSQLQSARATFKLFVRPPALSGQTR